MIHAQHVPFGCGFPQSTHPPARPAPRFASPPKVAYLRFCAPAIRCLSVKGL